MIARIGQEPARDTSRRLELVARMRQYGGDPVGARTAYDAAIRLAAEPFDEVRPLYGRASLDVELGQAPAAEADIVRAIGLARAPGGPLILLPGLLVMSGAVRLGNGEAALGVERLEEALQLARAFGLVPTQVTCLCSLAAAHRDTDPARSAALLGEAASLSDRSGRRVGLTVRLNQASLRLTEGRPADALQLLEPMALDLEAFGSPEREYLRVVLGIALAAVGRLLEARSWLDAVDPTQLGCALRLDGVPEGPVFLEVARAEIDATLARRGDPAARERVDACLAAARAWSATNRGSRNLETLLRRFAT